MRQVDDFWFLQRLDMPVPRTVGWNCHQDYRRAMLGDLKSHRTVTDPDWRRLKIHSQKWLTISSKYIMAHMVVSYSEGFP